MTPFHTRLFGAVVALTLAAGIPALSQQLELKLMAPAAPAIGPVSGKWESARSCAFSELLILFSIAVAAATVACANRMSYCGINSRSRDLRRGRQVPISPGKANQPKKVVGESKGRRS